MAEQDEYESIPVKVISERGVEEGVLTGNEIVVNGKTAEQMRDEGLQPHEDNWLTDDL